MFSRFCYFSFTSENDSSSMAGSPTASNAKVLETLSQQYEDMLRNKETEISKLREDLKKAIRGNNSIDSVRRYLLLTAILKYILIL